jgi:hypothetical protein
LADKNRLSTYLFYALLSLIVFFPCFFLGKVCFQDDLLMLFNFSRQFLADQIADGRFPLWNPYLLGGQPFFADPNAMAAYPLLYPTLLLPGAYGLSFFFFIHLILAAWGARFFLKTLSLSEDACRLGAVTFALSGFFWWETIHPPLLAAFCWLPWFFAFLEKSIQDPKPSRAFGAGLTFALLFLSGSYQMSLAAFYGGVLYFAVRLWTEKKKNPRGKSRWLPVFGSFGAGLFPLLLWLIPSLELIRASSRFQTPFDYDGFNAAFSMEPGKLSQFLFPTHPLASPSLPLDNAGYLGLWAPFLLAAAWKARRKEGLALAALCLLGLLLAFGKFLPFHRLACEWLPGFSWTQAPSRFICLYVLGGSCLAAMGYEAFQKEGMAGRKNGLFLPALIYAVLLAAFLLLKPSFDGGLILSLGLGILALIWAKGSARKQASGPAWVFQLSILVSLLANAWGNTPTGPASNFDLALRMPFLQALRKEMGPNRLFIGNHIPWEVRSGEKTYLAKFPVNAAGALGLEGVNGYSPLRLRPFAEIHALPLATFVRLMAVRGFLLGPGENPGLSGAKTDWGPFQFYRMGEKLPLAWIPDRVDILSDPIARLAALSRKDFDPYRQAYLSAYPSTSDAKGLSGKKAAGKCERISLAPDDSVYQVRLDHPGLVVFSEQAAPGWRAFLDGAPVEIYQADHLLKSLVVPAGAHEIRFHYRPWWVYPGLALGVLWVLSLLGACFFRGRFSPF